jgi:hypothetical protein
MRTRRRKGVLVVGGKEEEKRRGRAGRAVLFIAHRLLDVFLF